MGMGEEGDTTLNDEPRRMARDVTQKHGTQLGGKHAHDNDGDNDKEGEDGNGSALKDLHEPVSIPIKKAGKAKSPTKSVPTTDRWTAADLDSVRQNRYGLDQADV